MRFKLWMALAVSMLMTACVDNTGQQSDRAGDNKIGQALAAVSAVISESGNDQSQIAMYDKTTCMIHQFDMANSKYMRSLKPRVPSVNGNRDHKIMFEPNGNFVIDLIQSSLTVYDSAGNAQDPHLTFVGNPTNGVFRPSLGCLVMQDDRNTVGLLKISTDGTVVAKRSLGQIVHDNVTYGAGDIDDQGRLILSLSDDTIAIIDIDQSIAQNKWVMTANFPSGLSKVNWVSAIHDRPNQILVKTADTVNGSPVNVQLAIIDVSAQSVLSTYSVPSNRNVVKASKSYDPHFIVKDTGTYLESNNATVVYPQGGTLKHVDMTDQMRNVLSSYMNLADDTWTFIDSDNPQVLVDASWIFGWILYDDPNAATTGRQLKEYGLSTLFAKKEMSIPNGTTVEMSNDHLFQLFDSTLGKAQNFTLAEPGYQEIKGFNQQFIHQNPCQ